MDGKELYRRNWSEHDRGVIKRLLDSINANKIFINKTLQKDIENAILLCIRLKDTIDGHLPQLEVDIQEDSSVKERNGYLKFLGI